MADATKAAELRVGVSFEDVPGGGVLRAFVGFPARSQRRRAWCRAAEPTASRFCRSLTMRASRSTSARSEVLAVIQREHVRPGRVMEAGHGRIFGVRARVRGDTRSTPAAGRLSRDLLGGSSGAGEMLKAACFRVPAAGIGWPMGAGASGGCTGRAGLAGWYRGAGRGAAAVRRRAFCCPRICWPAALMMPGDRAGSG